MPVHVWCNLYRDVFELTKEQEEGNNTNTEVVLKYFTVLLYLPSRSACEIEFLLVCVCIHIYIYTQIGIWVLSFNQSKVKIV